MTIRIYLDSSDYSILYREPRSKEINDVIDYLVDKTNSGQVEIGFSYPVIWELLQDFSEKYREDRIKRAEMIKKLCGQNAFLYPYNMKEGSAFSHEGHWYPGPKKPFSTSDMEQEWISMIQNNDLLIRNRKQRRALMNVKHRRKVIRENPSLCDLKMSQLAETYFPSSFVDEGVFYKYMAGEISLEEADKELLKIVTDPVIFIRSWFNMAKKKNPFTDAIHNGATKLRDSVMSLQEVYRRAYEANRTLKGMEKRFYKESASQESIQAIKEIRHNVKEAMKLQRYIKADEGIWALLGDHTVEIIIAYLSSNLVDEQDIEDSDFADIWHAIYIPHCDLWRGDSKFSNMLIRQRITHKDRIVPTLRELSKRISGLLTTV